MDIGEPFEQHMHRLGQRHASSVRAPLQGNGVALGHEARAPSVTKPTLLDWPTVGLVTLAGSRPISVCDPSR